jgi:excisionase family DNA binding protein
VISADVFKVIGASLVQCSDIAARCWRSAAWWHFLIPEPWHQVAELLGTSERFPRRLIAERRIRFVKLGRHVRIPGPAVREFIDAGRVDPLTVADTWQRRRGVA